jgi:hypothetical protein
MQKKNNNSASARMEHRSPGKELGSELAVLWAQDISRAQALLPRIGIPTLTLERLHWSEILV